MRKNGNVNGGGVSQKWFEFLNAGERIITPMAEGEMIIAKALGTDPWVIWPSRYHDPQPMSLSTERS
ncbi:helix-turn-helix domain-containing protein [Escherichia coli]